MAYEIEVKAYVADKQRIISALNARGCEWYKTKRQYDEVYYLQNQEIYFRIRNEDNTNLLTLKKIIDKLEVIEYESEIGNCEEVRGMILTLGFEEYVIIDKERLTGKVEDFNICLDEVKFLGNFIEVEKVVEREEERETTKDELMRFLLSLGVKEEKICDERYHTMLYDIQKRR